MCHTSVTQTSQAQNGLTVILIPAASELRILHLISGSSLEFNRLKSFECYIFITVFIQTCHSLTNFFLSFHFIYFFFTVLCRMMNSYNMLTCQYLKTQ